MKKIQTKIKALRKDSNDYDFEAIDECMQILRELDKAKDSYLSKQLVNIISKRATMKGVDYVEQIKEANYLLD